jgi:hypothetical protein
MAGVGKRSPRQGGERKSGEEERRVAEIFLNEGKPSLHSRMHTTICYFSYKMLNIKYGIIGLKKKEKIRNCGFYFRHALQQLSALTYITNLLSNNRRKQQRI